MGDPVAWGRARAPEIAELIDTADLMLAPFAESEEALLGALKSENANVRVWATTVCSAYGVQATELVETARTLLRDDQVPVRIRAAEFLALAGAIDPRPTLVTIHNGTENPVERLIALQSAALFHEHAPVAHPFEASAFTSAKPGSEGERRLVYFAGEWLGNPKGKK